MTVKNAEIVVRDSEHGFFVKIEPKDQNGYRFVEDREEATHFKSIEEAYVTCSDLAISDILFETVGFTEPFGLRLVK